MQVGHQRPAVSPRCGDTCHLGFAPVSGTSEPQTSVTPAVPLSPANDENDEHSSTDTWTLGTDHLRAEGP